MIRASAVTRTYPAVAAMARSAMAFFVMALSPFVSMLVATPRVLVLVMATVVPLIDMSGPFVLVTRSPPHAIFFVLVLNALVLFVLLGVFIHRMLMRSSGSRADEVRSERAGNCKSERGEESKDKNGNFHGEHFLSPEE